MEVLPDLFRFLTLAALGGSGEGELSVHLVFGIMDTHEDPHLWRIPNQCSYPHCMNLPGQEPSWEVGKGGGGTVWKGRTFGEGRFAEGVGRAEHLRPIPHHTCLSRARTLTLSHPCVLFTRFSPDRGRNLGRCSQGLGPNDNVRAATQRLAGISRLSLSRSHYTDTDPTSRGPDCARLRLEPATSAPRSEATSN
ncbi:hypothetical protein ElyMa_002152100 [Elysia marginata]|uniref:Uncharacterized protein n=1 Tax=Elysia marginata TaxID=1093978 RepID=A0AAV4FM46_9GAST|nr:hypothetical protein ElyMa_002152100 [Elysia marginata]